MAYEREKQIAIAAIILAAKLCERVRQEDNSATLRKADTSPVTIADFGSQGIICQALSAAFPDDSIIAEEDATLLQKPEFASILTQVTEQVKIELDHTREDDIVTWINQGNGSIASRYWTLDPIDGTKGYLRGDQYAIALALIEQGKVQLGMLACPALPLDYQQPESEVGVIFVASRGEGTIMSSLDGKWSYPISVNQTGNIGKIRRLESVESSHSDQTRQNYLDQILGLTQPSKPMDSQAKYGAVARGEGDLYLRIPVGNRATRPENIWDHAAGAIIVEEAGGKVTDLRGKSLDFSLGTKLSENYGIVASNGLIHEQVIKALLVNIP